MRKQSIEVIGDRAFYECHSLKAINLPDSLKQIGSRAFDGTSIIKIEIPKSITNWGRYVFANTKLEEAVLPDDMTVVPQGLFYYSTLEKVNIPKNLKQIKKEAFMGTLVDVQAFLNNTNLTTIGEKAFAGTQWTKLVIPENIRNIGSQAFDKWDSEKRKIIIKGNTKGFKQNAFSGEFTDKLNDTAEFESGIKEAFTDIRINTMSNNEKARYKTRISIDWSSVKGVYGYELKVSRDKRFKTNLKTIIIKGSKTKKVIKLKKMERNVYVRIRPYRIEKGKKVYGKWTIDKMNL